MLLYVMRGGSQLRYVVDIGASEGLFANYVARQHGLKSKNPAIVYAIEPIPEVASKIGSRENIVKVIAAVLSEKSISVSGKASLNIFKNKELSSILTINGELDSNVWGEHMLGTLPIQTIEVPAFTLEQFMISYKIKCIDFLKIDTQGLDLDVLESAGQKITRIKAAVLEVPYSVETALYKSETDLSVALEKVKLLGFSPVRIVPNGGGECNLFLRHRSFSVADYFEMERELGFAQAPTLKIGPHNPYAKKPWPVRSIYRVADALYNFVYSVCNSKPTHQRSIN